MTSPTRFCFFSRHLKFWFDCCPTFSCECSPVFSREDAGRKGAGFIQGRPSGKFIWTWIPTKSHNAAQACSLLSLGAPRAIHHLPSAKTSSTGRYTLPFSLAATASIYTEHFFHVLHCPLPLVGHTRMHTRAVGSSIALQMASRPPTHLHMTKVDVTMGLLASCR